jgi:hypothetical protein
MFSLPVCNTRLYGCGHGGFPMGLGAHAVTQGVRLVMNVDIRRDMIFYRFYTHELVQERPYRCTVGGIGGRAPLL